MTSSIEHEIATLKNELHHLDDLIENTDESIEIYGRSQLFLLREARKRRIEEIAFWKRQSHRF